jgi:DNA polymerase-3 subunit beta
MLDSLMRFTVRQKSLLKEIDLLRGVASRKSKEKINPALKGYLLQATESGLIISATDTEVSITTTCPVEPLTTVTPGSIIIPAGKLCDIVRRFDNLPLDFELLENNRIQIRCGESEYKIACEEAIKFPDIPRPEIYPASIPLSVLLGQIIRTEFAIPNDQSTAPKGILFDIKDNVMSMLALDGNQCSSVKSNVTFPLPINVPIPRSGIEELSKLLTDVKDEKEGLISIACDENHIFFKMGDRTMISRLLASSFPDTSSMFNMFSSDHNTIVAIVEQFTNKLQGAAVMSDERQPRVKLDIADGFMTLTSQSDEGNAKEKIKIASNGLKTEIVFDTRYLLPSLSTMKVDSVQMDIISPEKPVLLTPLKEENFEWRIIIMPCRIL